MKFHINVKEKRTTITVDDPLCSYMLAKIGGIFSGLGLGKDGYSNNRQSVRKWIQKTIDKEHMTIPDRNISQWVQNRILEEIVDPAIKAKKLAQIVDAETLTEKYGIKISV